MKPPLPRVMPITMYEVMTRTMPGIHAGLVSGCQSYQTSTAARIVSGAG